MQGITTYESFFSSGSAGGKVSMTCGQVMVAPPTSPDYETSNIKIKPPTQNTIEEDYDNDIIDNPRQYPTSPDKEENMDDLFDTYDFIENQGSFAYNIDNGKMCSHFFVICCKSKHNITIYLVVSH